MIKQICANPRCKKEYWTHDLSSDLCFDCRTAKPKQEQKEDPWRPRSRSMVVDEGIPGAEER